MSRNPEFFITFINRSDFKVRLMSLMGSFTCSITGILLALSIGASLFHWAFINRGPGDLFIGAYGLFAFFIPLYLFWAAWLFFDPAFKPGRIFLFSVVVVPFLTLALGFTLIRDFEIYRQEFAFLEILGQFSFGLTVITIIVLECLGILILQKVLFSRTKRRLVLIKTHDPIGAAVSKTAEPDTVSPQIYSTVPGGSAEPRSSGTLTIHNSPPIQETVTSAELYKLPDWEPLKSTAAFEELNRNHPPIPETRTKVQYRSSPPHNVEIPLRKEKTNLTVSKQSAAAEEILVLDNSVFSPYSQASEELEELPVFEELPALEEEFSFKNEEFTGEKPASIKKEEFAEEEPVSVKKEEFAGEEPASMKTDNFETSDFSEIVEMMEPEQIDCEQADYEQSGFEYGQSDYEQLEIEEYLRKLEECPNPFVEIMESGQADGKQAESNQLEYARVNYGQLGEDDLRELEKWTNPFVKKNETLSDTEAAGTEAVEVLTAAKKKLTKHKDFYSVPVDGILNQYSDGQYWIVDEETHREARVLRETLSEFNIQAEVTGIRKGPVITMFEILPAPGVKLSKIVNLQDNIALRLAASSVRIVAPIPGKHAVGIEVPNKKRNIVSFREIIEGELNHKKESRKNEIPMVLGKGITGDAVTIDLCQMPHLLIAGATGSGKSVCVNSMILSILYQLPPANCRLIMIDPKIVELKLYNDIPHLLTPVITEPKRAFQALQYCIYEMERRYACLDSMGVRDIKSYNRRIKERNIAALHMPYIVVIIDEFADLMATTGKELESTVARLAAMSRAVGIHLVLATQRPSIDVITGLIKANIPSRIAFMVASKMDSRIIIDMVGAEKLLGKGDMLYAGAVDPFPIRMQGAFVSEEEVERVVEHVKTLGEPEYIDDEIFFDDDEEDTGPSLFSEGDDPLYDKALEVVIQQGKASASFIQRRLKIGYNRAARLVEEMEHRGVVGPAQGSRPRELLRAG